MFFATTKVVFFEGSIHARGPTAILPILIVCLIRPSFPGLWGENSFMGVFLGLDRTMTVTVFGTLVPTHLMVTESGLTPGGGVMMPGLVHCATYFWAL